VFVRINLLECIRLLSLVELRVNDENEIAVHDQHNEGPARDIKGIIIYDCWVTTVGDYVVCG